MDQLIFLVEGEWDAIIRKISRSSINGLGRNVEFRLKIFGMFCWRLVG